MDDKYGLIDELIFENLLNTNYNKKQNTIKFNDGKKIPATIKSVWKELEKIKKEN